MPTRKEQRRSTLNKRRNALVAKIEPLDREINFIDQEIKLLDEYEGGELSKAETALGLSNPGNED